MTKLTALTLAAALFCLPVSEAHASSAADFTLINDTGFTIKSIRFKAHKAPLWGNDVLANTVLFQGGVAPIEFYSLPSCNLDIQIEYMDGSSHNYIDGQNLCRTHGIRFKFGVSDSW